MNIDKHLKDLNQKKTKKLKGGADNDETNDKTNDKKTYETLLNKYPKIRDALNQNASRKETIEYLKTKIGSENPGTTTPLWIEKVQEFVVQLQNVTDLKTNKIDILKKILPDASSWMDSYAEDLNLFSNAYYQLMVFSNKAQKDLSRGAISLLMRPVDFIQSNFIENDRTPIITPPADLATTDIEDVRNFVLKLPFEMLNAVDFQKDKPRAFALVWFALAPYFQSLILSIFKLLERKLLFSLQTEYSEIIYQIPKNKLSGVPWNNKSQKIGLTPAEIDKKITEVSNEYNAINAKPNRKIIDWIQMYIKAAEYTILEHAKLGNLPIQIISYKIQQVAPAAAAPAAAAPAAVPAAAVPATASTGGRRFIRKKNRVSKQKGGSFETIKTKITEWKKNPYNTPWALPNDYKNLETVGKQFILFYLDEEQTALNQLESYKTTISNQIKKASPLNTAQYSNSGNEEST